MSSYYFYSDCVCELVWYGGALLCSIARGRGRNDEAEVIMGNAFFSYWFYLE